jgi:hypothetical protein
MLIPIKIGIHSKAIIYSTFLALSGAGPNLLSPLVPGINVIKTPKISPIIGIKSNNDSQPEQLKSCNLFIVNKIQLTI